MKFTQTIRDYITKKTVVDRVNTTLTTSYVSAGEIDVRNLKSVKIFPIFDKNNATSGSVKVTELHTSGGVEHQVGQYTNSTGTLSLENWVWTYTADGNVVPIRIDVTDMNYIKIYAKSTGGTADAKMAITYLSSNQKG